MKTIPGLLRAVQYERTGRHSGPYVHTAEGPTKIVGLKDGSVKLRATDGRPLWGVDEAGEAWLENRPKRKESSMAHRHHHNPYLAAYNPSAVKALTHYFSARGLTAAAMAGGAGIAGAGGTFLAERITFSYLTFLTPWALATDWTSILVRGATRLGLVGALAWLFGNWFGHHNRTAFVAGGLTYAVGATAFEAIGTEFRIGSGVPLQSYLARFGLTAVAGAGAFIQRGTVQARVGDFVATPVQVGDVGAFITQPSSRVPALRGAGDLWKNPFIYPYLATSPPGYNF